MRLALAPLQTYTDYHFRNAFQQVFSGVDVFYAPYLKMNNDGTMKTAPTIDVLPKNNPKQPIIPQLMACSSSEFFVMANYLADLGYSEVNWNMGCPYPMVTNKNLGAGILNQPSHLRHLLEEIFPKSPLKIGIKMRMGMEDTSEIHQLLPILNDFPITEIIIHARNAKQLYTGSCDHDQFFSCIPISKAPLTYNGDITNLEEWNELNEKFPEIDRWMIGRGAVCNPSIFEGIKTGKVLSEEVYYQNLILFNRYLRESLERSNSDKGYALIKLKSYWEYLATSLEEGNRLFRKLKKAKHVDDFCELIEKMND